MKKVLMSAVLMLAAISFANAQDVKTEKKKCDKTEKCEKCKKHKDVDGKTGATTKAEKCDFGQKFSYQSITPPRDR